MRLIHAKVRGGMGLFHLQRRFVFAQASMSSEVRLVIYIYYSILYRDNFKKREFVSNRLRVVSKRLVSKRLCIEAPLSSR